MPQKDAIRRFASDSAHDGQRPALVFRSGTSPRQERKGDQSSTSTDCPSAIEGIVQPSAISVVLGCPYLANHVSLAITVGRMAFIHFRRERGRWSEVGRLRSSVCDALCDVQPSVAGRALEAARYSAPHELRSLLRTSAGGLMSSWSITS